MIDISNTRFDIYEGQGKIKIVTKDWYLTARLQQVTKHYPIGTVFAKDDEPVFHFDYMLLGLVLDTICTSSNQRNALLSTINQQRTILDKRRG